MSLEAASGLSAKDGFGHLTTARVARAKEEHAVRMETWWTHASDLLVNVLL